MKKEVLLITFKNDMTNEEVDAFVEKLKLEKRKWLDMIQVLSVFVEEKDLEDLKALILKDKIASSCEKSEVKKQM